MVIPQEKLSLLQLITQVNSVQNSLTPMNNQNRRISLVVPQPTGSNQQTSHNQAVHQQHIQHSVSHQQNQSADGRKKNVTDKKKKSVGRIAQEISSSVERLSNHKFSASSYVNENSYKGNGILNQGTQLFESNHSGKKKISKSRVSQLMANNYDSSIGVSIVNQKVTPKTLNTVYTQEQIQQMRNQSLSPPPNNRAKTGNILQNVISKSNSKNTNSSIQRSTKKINQLKSLVKKQQQQKSLSRDFTNTLINNAANNTKQSQVQLHIYKSQNQQTMNNTLTNHSNLQNSLSGLCNYQMQTLPNKSVSPNSRLVDANSAQKKKEKINILRKKNHENQLTQSVQLFKPPINKNIQNALMQTSLNLKSGFNSILNESKETMQTRSNLTQQPNVSLSMTQSQINNITQNSSQINTVTHKQNKEKSAIRKQSRNSTQERLLKAAEAQIHQIEQELHVKIKKNTTNQQQSHTNSYTTLQPDQQKLRQLVQNTLQTQSEYLNKESKQVQLGGAIINKKSQQNSQCSSTYIKTEDLFQLDKTFSDIIETLQSQAVPTDNQIQSMKQQANITLIKSQLEKIKNSYEQIIKKLSDSQSMQSLSARLKQQRLLSDRQQHNEDENTTHATNSNNDCFSASSSFRTQQNAINQTQLQQKILDLEHQNLMLQNQMKQKDETIAHQEQIIELLKQETKKEDAGTQTINQKSVCSTPAITDRKADLIVDNEQLKRQNKRLQKKVEYHKNKENKFLFFLFSLQNQGIPVNEIYEKEGIKDIPTSRFAEIMQEEQSQNPNNQSSMLFSFYSDDSYEPIDDGPDPAQKQKRPAMIPQLNLNNLPEYESSSDEEGDQDNQKNEVEYQNGVQHRNMTSQDYEQSMKYIENFYSKCSTSAPMNNNNGLPQITVDSDTFEEDDDHNNIVMHHDQLFEPNYQTRGYYTQNIHNSNSVDGGDNEQDYIMCQINQGSSILFEKEASHSHLNPPMSHCGGGPSSMLMDDDFCYSIDKQSKRRSSKDMMSV